MARGIDHLVLAVHELEEARALYARLGFTLTPTARHPFGTHNSLMQLEGCFLELLAVHDENEMPAAKPGEFSFPRFNKRFLDRRQGMSMLVLESADAKADANSFAAAGLQSYPLFEFGRDARQPDGSTARVGFRLAFASDPAMPEAGFFACQQLAPDYFWKPEFQRHPNSAKTITEVVMITESPADHRAFMQGFIGTERVQESEAGTCFESPRGRVRLMTPLGAERMWGAAVDSADFGSPRFAAYVVGVSDIGATRGELDAGRVPFTERGGRLVVPAAEAMGVAIGFEAV